MDSVFGKRKDNSVLEKDARIARRDNDFLQKLDTLIQQQVKTSTKKLEDEKKTVDSLSNYAALIKEDDPNSLLAKLLDNISNALIKIQSDQHKMNEFLLNSFSGPLKIFVQREIKSAINSINSFEEASVAYDTQLKKFKNSGKSQHKEELTKLKQISDEYEINTRNKLLDARTSCSIQMLHFFTNFVDAHFASAQNSVDQLQNLKSDLSTYRNAAKNLNEGFLESQLSRPKTTVRKPNELLKTKYGVPIEKVFEQENAFQVGLPGFLKVIFNYIHTNCLTLEGAFRLSASKEQLRAFRISIDQGNVPDFAHVDDSHIVCQLLGQWLRELPDPLLTYVMYERFKAFGDIDFQSNQKAHTQLLRNLIGQLPTPNKIVLHHLLDLLYKIQLNHEVNKMSARNLSIVFGPTILVSETADPLAFDVINQVVETMIQNYPALVEGAPVSTSNAGLSRSTLSADIEIEDPSTRKLDIRALPVLPADLSEQIRNHKLGTRQNIETTTQTNSSQPPVPVAVTPDAPPPPPPPPSPPSVPKMAASDVPLKVLISSASLAEEKLPPAPSPSLSDSGKFNRRRPDPPSKPGDESGLGLGKMTITASSSSPLMSYSSSPTLMMNSESSMPVPPPQPSGSPRSSSPAKPGRPSNRTPNPMMATISAALRNSFKNRTSHPLAESTDSAEIVEVTPPKKEEEDKSQCFLDKSSNSGGSAVKKTPPPLPPPRPDRPTG
eukprot:TRINITY_DN8402_c0_g1_i1.p1 TRINITY_DN8402_c0_g1~~TRINITY_DN8402_c0_g1_i1.p1  ORF type:complete len:721 (+),score=174.37 TRINITY_DN8402_c0_g1_i1:22-2184(+)